jgi:ATP-binding cassette subfamily B (MDR/TAP) protein 1
MRGSGQDDNKPKSLDNEKFDDDDMGMSIQLQDVWFRYPTRDTPVLRGLSLEVRIAFISNLRLRTCLTDTCVQIKEGQFAAIVGPSGNIAYLSQSRRIPSSNVVQDVERRRSSRCWRGKIVPI